MKKVKIFLRWIAVLKKEMKRMKVTKLKIMTKISIKWHKQKECMSFMKSMKKLSLKEVPKEINLKYSLRVKDRPK